MQRRLPAKNRLVSVTERLTKKVHLHAHNPSDFVHARSEVRAGHGRTSDEYWLHWNLFPAYRSRCWQPSAVLNDLTMSICCNSAFFFMCLLLHNPTGRPASCRDSPYPLKSIRSVFLDNPWRTRRRSDILDIGEMFSTIWTMLQDRARYWRTIGPGASETTQSLTIPCCDLNSCSIPFGISEFRWNDISELWI